MFKKQYESHETVTIIFEGKSLDVEIGQTVAAALLGDGHLIFRYTRVSGEPRAAYCFMGVCFECLLEINGQRNQQGCMIPVSDGMKIKRQMPPKGKIQ